MDSIRILTHNAPGQNLDRRIAGERLARERGSPLLDWERRDTDNQTVKLGYGSKGLNHELILNVTGPFTLSSNDSILSLSEDGTLTYTSDNWPYPLRHVDERDGFDPGHPGRIWTNTSRSSHEQVKVPLQCKITIRTDFLGGSRVWINDKFAGRFEVFIFGGRNTLFSWSQMAFVAPLDVVQGGIRRLTINPCESAAPPVPPSSPAGPNPPTSTGLAPGHSIPAVQVLLVFLLLQLLTLPGAESI
jgi:hexosaminidase